MSEERPPYLPVVREGGMTELRAHWAASRIVEAADPARRALPLERTALHQLFEAQRSLARRGWLDLHSCPQETEVRFISVGSTGITLGHRSGNSFWAHEAGDLWPLRPILWKAK